jgi:hypothetical protein
VSVVCCPVKASASGLSLVRGSSTECGIFGCDREAHLGLSRQGGRDVHLLVTVVTYENNARGI